MTPWTGFSSMPQPCMELVVGQFLLRAVFFSLLIFLDMAGISLAYGERKNTLHMKLLERSLHFKASDAVAFVASSSSL